MDSILNELRNCHSLSQIAMKYNVSRGRIQQIKKANEINARCSLNGRPRKLDTRHERMVARQIVTGHAHTATEIIQTMPILNVSPRTIRRTLHRQGLTARKAMKKPLLTKRHRKNRLDFAMAHQDWVLHDWRQVIFSDETKINRYWSDGKKWNWSRGKDSYNESNISGTMKFGGGSLMAWGCITSEGPGFLTKIDVKLDSGLYCNILNDEFLQTCAYFDLDSTKVIFQQDNDPKHTSKKVKKWLSDHNINVLQWPSQSPDLNPIEHIWVLLKRKLNMYENPPSGMLELWERVSNEWEAITKEDCLNVIDSMPSRIQSVLQAKGSYTKY